MKDSLKEVCRVIGRADEFTIISENCYGAYSPAVKNILDRSNGLADLGFQRGNSGGTAPVIGTVSVRGTVFIVICRITEGDTVFIAGRIHDLISGTMDGKQVYCVTLGYIIT